MWEKRSGLATGSVLLDLHPRIPDSDCAHDDSLFRDIDTCDINRVDFRRQGNVVTQLPVHSFGQERFTCVEQGLNRDSCLVAEECAQGIGLQPAVRSYQCVISAEVVIEVWYGKLAPLPIVVRCPDEHEAAIRISTEAYRESELTVRQWGYRSIPHRNRS